jgi:hypothetical protein
VTTFRQAWESLASWVPAPLQIGLALVICLLVLTKLFPRIVHVVGVLVRAAWAPLVQLFTYPEFLLTSASRQLGKQPLPGTFAYDRALGTVYSPGLKAGEWLATRRRTFRFPWKSAVLIIAILTSCWYIAPKVPPGGARSVLTDVNTDDVHLDSWISTGKWTPAVTLATCTKALVDDNSQRHHERPHAHRRR